MAEVLDGRANVFQSLKAELYRINIRCVHPLDEIGELAQHRIRLGNLLPCPHHGHIEHPTTGVARLKFKLFEHVTQSAG